MVFLLVLLLISGPVLWLLNRLKVRYGLSWFWAIFVCVLLWVGVLSMRGRLPQTIGPLSWGIDETLSPVLLLDAVSWPFALTLAGLGLAVVLTSAQRLADGGAVPEAENEGEVIPYEDWRNQAVVLVSVFLGLLGVLAGNPLTLLLAWAGADLFGLWVVLIRISGREESERMVLDFSARVAGIYLLLWAMIAAKAAGHPFEFRPIPGEVYLHIILACGFRLGVLPLQVYFFTDLPLRRGLGTMVRMVTPAVSSLVLLVRVAMTEYMGSLVIASSLLIPLLTLIALTGLYAAFSWWMGKNELESRTFWVLGMGSLTVASAVRGQPAATLAWGLALLLAGAGLFLFSARTRGLRGVLLLSAVMISALPGTPTALGMSLYAGEFSWNLAVLVGVQALLLAGYVRHVLREGETGQVVVPAIRVAYTLGLLVLPGTFILAGGIGWGDRLPDTGWLAWIGVGLAGVLGGWAWRGGKLPAREFSVLRHFFSFHWLYRLFWRGYRLLGGGVAFVTVLLEGEAGVLWTLLLLFLLISLITTQAGLGG